VVDDHVILLELSGEKHPCLSRLKFFPRKPIFVRRTNKARNPAADGAERKSAVSNIGIFTGKLERFFTIIPVFP
jgi:hypothetical protein